MTSTAAAVSPLAQGRTALLRHWFVIVQLLLALWVVHIYQIESPALPRVLMLTTAGFAVSVVLPLAYRLQFFVLLSLAGILWVLGPADGAWLIAAGLVLIGMSHIPIPIPWRVAILLVTGTALAVLRAGVGPTIWSAAVWPILGSMFMFRLVLYVRAVAAGQAGKGIWDALAYFFMLPNVAFPLFPVVDYQTFRRTYFDKSEAAIYEQGLLWVARGLLHLVLYRFVYHSVLNDPADVMRLGDLVQFMLGTFLLYLRVSGQFHLIVGLLHLFGFRLPETHKLYYLAHSFTELWRRINIYWTDFMMKVVFYPTYFRVKRLGPAAGVGLATAAVFLTTWILHSYQWFWLRGGFPLTAQDTLFWGILGALVIAGALKELKTSKAPRRKAGAFSVRLGLRAAVTFCLFCFLWSLWSAESVSGWMWTLSAAANVDAKGVILLVLTFGTIFVLGGRDWEAAKTAKTAKKAQWLQFATQPVARTLGSLIALIVVAQPLLHESVPAQVAAALRSTQSTGLNAQDAALQHRGYYEQLEVRGNPNAQVLDTGGGARGDWDDPASAGILRQRHDLVERDLVPSHSVMWNGNRFSTNSWGMRDREYAREKGADTFRIALLGPSHVMGNGVADGETFEQLVEDRLNRESGGNQGRRYEILNFGVDGYTMPQQLAMLHDRALAFSPDMIIVTDYHRARIMTERYVAKIVAEDIPVPDGEFSAILRRAGLTDVDRGSVAIPFQSLRTAARWFGIEPRMPSGESATRARWVADEVNAWAIGQIADVARRSGAQPVVLALNAVIDDAPSEIPDAEAIRAAGLPVLDLFDIYPAEQRAALRVAPWDDHPNAAGHRLIADRLYEKLLPLLTQPAMPDSNARN